MNDAKKSWGKLAELLLFEQWTFQKRVLDTTDKSSNSYGCINIS